MREIDIRESLSESHETTSHFDHELMEMEGCGRVEARAMNKADCAPTALPGAPQKIAGEQTISTAAELHRVLTECLERNPAIVLDLSDVHVIDTAGLQMIYALRYSASQRKQPFQITAVSAEIAETMASLGLPMEALTTAFDCSLGRSSDGGI